MSSLAISSASAESLWLKATTDERGMFAERKASRVGDILRVSVDESNTFALDMATKNSKTASTFDNPLHRYLLREGAGFLGFDKDAIVQDDFKSTSNHDGSGSVGINNYSLTTTFSVTVIDVLPNSNLVIEGVRRVRFAKETVYTILRGIVRSDDVRKDNIISSNQISDMQVEVIMEGDLSDTQEKGLINKLNNSVNLF